MTGRRERLFLLDGYALAYRAFFAQLSRPVTTTHGENTSVPWGFTIFGGKILQNEAPEYLVVGFARPVVLGRVAAGVPGCAPCRA